MCKSGVAPFLLVMDQVICLLHLAPMETPHTIKNSWNGIHYTLFSVICTMLQWWMLTLIIATVSNNEVSVNTSSGFEPKAQSSNCSKYSVLTVFLLLLALYNATECILLIWSFRQTAPVLSAEASPIFCSNILLYLQEARHSKEIWWKGRKLKCFKGWTGGLQPNIK